MFGSVNVFLLLCALGFVAFTMAEIQSSRGGSDGKITERTDLEAAPTSAQLFNLGSLFGQTPGYGYNYYPNNYRPNYYPNYGTGSGYYPYSSSGWLGSNYPNYGYNSYYPSTSNGYYSNGYYPTGSTTNILGNGGYGGYGGNGGLRQYNGYWNPSYIGHRNRGYGYYADTDRFGFSRSGYPFGYDGSRSYSRGHDRLWGGYRGYD